MKIAYLTVFCATLFLCSHAQAGLMAGVLTVEQGEAFVKPQGSRKGLTVTASHRVGEGDRISLRSGRGQIHFFDNSEASLEVGASYTLSSWGMERHLGPTSLLVHGFKTRLSRDALTRSLPSHLPAVGKVIPVAQTRIRSAGEYEWTNLTSERELRPNDQVWTGPNGAARLVSRCGAVVQLRDNTRGYVFPDSFDVADIIIAEGGDTLTVDSWEYGLDSLGEIDSSQVILHLAEDSARLVQEGRPTIAGEVEDAVHVLDHPLQAVLREDHGQPQILVQFDQRI